MLLGGIVIAGLCGCEDNKGEYLDDYSLRVYFRNGGTQDITLYSVGENTDYEIPVCKGGSDLHAPVGTRLAVMEQAQLDIYNMSEKTNYRQLPANCYEFKTPMEMEFGDGELSKTAVVEMKTDMIRALKDTTDDGVTCVLALQLYADGPVSPDINRLILVPSVETPRITFAKESEKVFYTSNDPTTNECTVQLQLDMDNRWDFNCTVAAQDTGWLKAYNEENDTKYELMQPSQYTLPETVEFKRGSNTADIVLSVDRTDFEPFVDYVLPLHLTGCTKPEMQIDDESTYLLVARLNPVTEKVTLTEEMLSTGDKFTMSGDGGGIPALVDGDTLTYWHSNYNESITGDATYGIYIDIKLASPLNVVKFSYYTRHNNNNAVPTKIRIGVRNSDDEEWEMIGEVSEGLTDEAGGMSELPVFFREKEFTQVRFGIAESKAGAGGVLTGETNGASTALGELMLEGAEL